MIWLFQANPRNRDLEVDVPKIGIGGHDTWLVSVGSMSSSQSGEGTIRKNLIEADLDSYGSAIRILQSPGFVVIHHEMIHETRVIPLDGYPHIAADICQ